MVQLSSLSKQQAHDLIDRMTPAQLSAVIGLMETFIAPQNLSVLKSPFGDEPLDEAPPSRGPAWLSSTARTSGAEERVRTELGAPADDTDFWPRAGQA